MEEEGKVTSKKNVLGSDLEVCCISPMTGFRRDGYCEMNADDIGTHVVCAEVTADFLKFSKKAGNDLSTAHPEHGFPGLKPGDKWCLCAARWKEAYDAGAAPPVVLKATHEYALEYVTLKELKEHAAEEV
jgi:uncharacterized protein